MVRSAMRTRGARRPRNKYGAALDLFAVRGDERFAVCRRKLVDRDDAVAVERTSARAGHAVHERQIPPLLEAGEALPPPPAARAARR